MENPSLPVVLPWTLGIGWCLYGCGLRHLPRMSSWLLLWTAAAELGVLWFPIEHERLPAYLRILGVLSLLVWCWALSVANFERAGYNWVALLGWHSLDVPSYLNSLVLTSSALSACFASTLLLFHLSPLLPNFDHEALALPLYLLLAFVFLTLAPQRDALFTASLRILGAPFFPVSFADIILADIFSSLSKVFADIEGLLCALVMPWVDTPEQVTTSPGCVHPLLGPLLMGLPSFWRLLQCLRLFSEEREMRHIKNAIKYSTAFPVIYLSSLHSASEDAKQATLVYWMLAASINSLYSFYWDVVHDWGFTTPRRARSQIAVAATITMDLMLRLTWSLKLSSHIHVQASSFSFILMLVEVGRRTMWIYWRFEHQSLKLAS